MPLLRALSSRASPATAAQLRRAAAAGTEAGVRRALDRLAVQGLVTTEEIGGRVVFLLNRDHVLYPAVTALLRAEEELPRRLRGEIPAWLVPPVAAALYGSAARRDGDADSDIDILLVRPASLGSRERELWNDQVHRLRDLVQRWTGNRCQSPTDRWQRYGDCRAHASQSLMSGARTPSAWPAPTSASFWGRRDRPPAAGHAPPAMHRRGCSYPRGRVVRRQTSVAYRHGEYAV